MKSTSIINPVIMENIECLIAKARLILKLGVLLDHGISLHFVLLKALQTC